MKAPGEGADPPGELPGEKGAFRDILVKTDTARVSADENARLWVGQSICESLVLRSKGSGRRALAVAHISALPSEEMLLHGSGRRALPDAAVQALAAGGAASTMNTTADGILDAMLAAFDGLGAGDREAVVVPNSGFDRSLTNALLAALERKVAEGRLGRATLGVGANNMCVAVADGEVRPFRGRPPMSVWEEMRP